MASSIWVKHNAEIAHRLSELPGKCQRIHGHSLHITLTITGDVDEHGILAGLDYGTVKAIFRKYIDDNYDHHLHLNENDPWAAPLIRVDMNQGQQLPGLVVHPADPTTENITKWICEWACAELNSAGITSVKVEIHETGTNGASHQLP